MQTEFPQSRKLPRSGMHTPSYNKEVEKSFLEIEFEFLSCLRQNRGAAVSQED